ncbi:hypothetical protein T492DRAFT_1016210, partial [Pavlovales sp. CCMP2436]
MWTGDRTGAIRACELGGSGGAWSPLVATAVEQLRAALRTHTIALIGQVHSSVSVNSTAATLGLSAEQVLALAAQHGWAVQAGTDGGVLQPLPVAKEGRRQELGMAQL